MIALRNKICYHESLFVPLEQFSRILILFCCDIWRTGQEHLTFHFGDVLLAKQPKGYNVSEKFVVVLKLIVN